MAFVNNHGVKIHYEVEGKGPPIILQHGIAGSGETWRSFGYVKDLSKDYRLILVDARGHGLSDKPHVKEAYRADIMASDYTAILDELKIPKSYYFGYSMGGRIGFGCIARYDLSRFDAIIIGGASPLAATEAEKQANIRRTADIETRGMQALVDFFEGREGPMPTVRKAQMLNNDVTAIVTMMLTSQLEWPPAVDVLPKINVPVLLFAGSLDPVHPNTQKAGQLIPGARFVSIEGFGHVQCYAHSDLVIPHVREFLSELKK
jgi:pimeloyl-ACP methyl ester carboxylesterase